MVLYRYGRFDDLVGQPGVEYVPPSRPPERNIALPSLTLSDTPDDFLVIEDAVLCHRGGLVWRDLWLSASIHYMPGHWREASWLPGKLTPDGTAIDLDPNFVKATGTIEDPVMLIDSGIGAHNFGHSIHDSMPYGLLFQRARTPIPSLRPLTAPFKFKKQHEIFSIVFDYPYQNCLHFDGGIRLEKLVLARRQAVMNNSDAQPDDHWYLPYAGLRHIRTSVHAAMKVPEEIGVLAEATPFSVFLHRFPNVAERLQSGLLQGRNFTNHYELFEALMAQSFVVFEPGCMTLDQIVSMLARTRITVAVHGAQVANTVFCRPGTRVFEIRGYPGNWRSIEAICAVLGHQFTPLQHSKPADPNAPEFDISSILAAVQA
jgi:hypothetical protein